VSENETTSNEPETAAEPSSPAVPAAPPFAPPVTASPGTKVAPNPKVVAAIKARALAAQSTPNAPPKAADGDPTFAYEALVAGWGNPPVTRTRIVNGRAKPVVTQATIPAPAGAAAKVRKVTPDWVAQATKALHGFASPSGTKTGKLFTEAQFDAMISSTSGVKVGGKAGVTLNHDGSFAKPKAKMVATHPGWTGVKQAPTGGSWGPSGFVVPIQDKLPPRIKPSKKQVAVAAAARAAANQSQK
jgi:hypothetical protein